MLINRCSKIVLMQFLFKFCWYSLNKIQAFYHKSLVNEQYCIITCNLTSNEHGFQF